MQKYMMNYYNGKDYTIIVEGNSFYEAQCKFMEYEGIPYPLEKKDIESLLQWFSVEKFISYFESTYGCTVYGIYLIEETLFEKEIKY